MENATDSFEGVDVELDKAEIIIRRQKDIEQKERLLNCLQAYREILEAFRYEERIGKVANDKEFLDFLKEWTTFYSTITHRKGVEAEGKAKMPHTIFRKDAIERVNSYNKIKVSTITQSFDVQTGGSIMMENYLIHKHDPMLEKFYEFIKKAEATTSTKGVKYRFSSFSQMEEEEVCRIATRHIRGLLENGEIDYAMEISRVLGIELQLYLLKHCEELLKNKKLKPYQVEFLQHYIDTGEPKEDEIFWEEYFKIEKDNPTWHINYGNAYYSEVSLADRKDEDYLQAKEQARLQKENDIEVIYIRYGIPPSGVHGMNINDLQKLTKALNRKHFKKKIKVIFGEGISHIGLNFTYCRGNEYYNDVDIDVRNLSRIVEIELPSTARMIDRRGFAGAKNLKKVVVPDGSRIVAIGDEAFKGCALTEFEVSDTLAIIGKGAFDDNPLMAPLDLSKTRIDADEPGAINLDSIRDNASQITLD